MKKSYLSFYFLSSLNVLDHFGVRSVSGDSGATFSLTDISQHMSWLNLASPGAPVSARRFTERIIGILKSGNFMRCQTRPCAK